MSSLSCKCGKHQCVCGVGQALIGPAELGGDGTVTLYWDHEKPTMRFPEVVAEFGTPNVLDTSPGGFAQWRKDVLAGTPYVEIVLRDEEIPHVTHYDYLTATVCADLSREVQIALMNVTESVWYDRLKHELSARCHFQGANVATLLLVTRMQLGHVPLDQAPGLYGGMIAESKDPETYAMMTADLARNLALIGCSPPQNGMVMGKGGNY